MHVITEMNKSGVAPEPAFKYLFTFIGGSTYKFYNTLSQYFTESAGNALDLLRSTLRHSLFPPGSSAGRGKHLLYRK